MKLNRQQYESLSPAQRAEVDEALLDLARLAEANPLVRFIPHAKQATFLQSHDRVKAFLGGNRSGKTTCSIVDDIIQAVDGSCLPARLLPYKKWHGPFHRRIVVPDFTGTLEGVIFQKLREWAPPSQLLGGSWGDAYNKQKRLLHFQNGSWFQFMTFEQELSKLGGAALHRVHCDEEPPEDIWNECMARLIDYGG